MWFGGGKLAADLTWPKLRQRWSRPDAVSGDRLSPGERDEMWAQAVRVVDDAAARIRLLAGTDPGGTADAAWAAGVTLHVAAAALGSRVLRQAADAYDRAARAPYGRIPRPSPTGDGLRRAARLISAFEIVSDDGSLRLVTLVTRLARLAEAVAALRQSQQRAAQAAGALSAAERLRAAAGTSARGQRGAASSAPVLAGAGFPCRLVRCKGTPPLRRREDRFSLSSGRRVDVIADGSDQIEGDSRWIPRNVTPTRSARAAEGHAPAGSGGVFMTCRIEAWGRRVSIALPAVMPGVVPEKERAQRFGEAGKQVPALLWGRPPQSEPDQGQWGECRGHRGEAYQHLGTAHVRSSPG